MEHQHETLPCPADTEEILAEIECLARSPNRLTMMYLLKQSPTTMTEMREILGVHRTTLGRNLAVLKGKNWVVSSPTENSHRLTRAGELIIDSFEELIRTTRTANRLGAFLTRFPETIPIEKERLRSSQITCPEKDDPLAPMSRLFEFLATSETIRGSVPVLGPMEGRVIANQIPAGTEIEMILGSTAWESLRVNHPSLFSPLKEADETELLVSSEDPSYGIFLIDERVVLVAYDEDMRIHSILEARESQEIIDWARQQYEGRKEAASQDVRVSR